MKVLKFGAVWCKECLVMRPMWEEIEKEVPGFESEYFDADENPEALEQHGIKDIPSFIFLDKSGGEITRLKGVQNKDELLRLVKDNIQK
jgi:thiol-disulfide isomerase/thioredoxin